MMRHALKIFGYSLVLVSLCCKPRPESSQPDTPVKLDHLTDLGHSTTDGGSGVLGRLNTVEIDLAEYRRAVAQTRILRKWRSNAESPLEALSQTALKRKIMLRALEARLVRAEVTRLDIPLDTTQLQRLIVNAAYGHPPDYPISANRVAPPRPTWINPRRKSWHDSKHLSRKLNESPRPTRTSGTAKHLLTRLSRC